MPLGLVRVETVGVALVRIEVANAAHVGRIVPVEWQVGRTDHRRELD